MVLTDSDASALPHCFQPADEIEARDTALYTTRLITWSLCHMACAVFSHLIRTFDSWAGEQHSCIWYRGGRLRHRTSTLYTASSLLASTYPRTIDKLVDCRYCLLFYIQTTMEMPTTVDIRGVTRGSSIAAWCVVGVALRCCTTLAYLTHAHSLDVLSTGGERRDFIVAQQMLT